MNPHPTVEITGASKALATWQAGNVGQLDEYVQVGDAVDEELYWYLLEILPPAHYDASLVQVGEPKRSSRASRGG